MPRPRSRSARRLQARLFLLVGDLGAIILAVSLLGVVRDPTWGGNEIIFLLIALLPIYAIVSFNDGALSLEALQRWQIGARRALGSLSVTTLLLLGIAFLLKISADYSRAVLAGGVVIAGIMLVIVRYLNSLVINTLFHGGILDVAVLVDGVEPPQFSEARYVDAAALGLRPLLNSPQMLDRVGKALQGCDRVVLCTRAERRGQWATVLKGLGTESYVLTPELDILGMLGITRFDDHLAAVIAWGPLRTSDKIIKRSVDIVFVLFCLPAICLITIVIAVLIKMDDGGPVFFWQQRIGQGNQIFSMLKFRSMREEAADTAGCTSTAREDSRITPIGKWLRRTSIDELPQLFNVLRGDMSVVGPRPHALGSTAEDLLFWDVDPRYWLRHAIKPGMTGLAQVRGFRGATMTSSDLIDRVQADLEYMVGWSVWKDIKILFGTVKVILHPNAY